MADLSLLLALLGGIVLLLSLGSGLLASRAFVPSEIVIAALVGVALGPRGLGLVRLAEWGPPLAVLEAVMQVTLAIAVMSVALRLPERYVRVRARSLALLLGPGMVLMWGLSSLVTATSLAVPVGMAVLVGAIVTPTDPVVASTIVVGDAAERNVPERLRHLLSAEAGANDGAAYPFVVLGITILGQGLDEGVVPWGLDALVWSVLGAVGLGLGLGVAVGRLERLLRRRGYLEDTSVFTITVALTFAALGAFGLAGTADVLGVFVAGLGYNWQSDPRDEAQEQKVEEVFNRVFTLPAFVLFGTALPWAAWQALGWRALAFVVGILLLRRFPMILALRQGIRPLDRPAATLFVGWFGPIGVAAIYYATLAARELGSTGPWVLTSLVVTGSILAHGATATTLTLWYGRLDDRNDGW